MGAPSAILLSAGYPVSLKVLYCLERLGFRTHVVDIGHPGVARYSRYCAAHAAMPLPVNAAEGQRLGEFLAGYMRGNGIDTIVGGDMTATGMLHAARPWLPPQSVVFPTCDLETLSTLDDKWRFHNFMVENAIPGPGTWLLESLGDLSGALGASLRFPLIVKPLNGESSHGVVCAGSLEEVVSHLGSGSKYAALPVLLQEFAPGYDADLSVLAQEGEVLAHVLQSRRVPGRIAFIRNDAVLDLGRQIVRAARYTGVANIDVRICEESGRITVLECNPRFWYTLQASMWRGINFVELGLDVARGRSITTPAPEGGKYILHGTIVKNVLRPSLWRGIESYNVQGFWQALSDPGPFVRTHFR